MLIKVSFFFLVGLGEDPKGLVVEFGCKVGSLPSIYLGLYCHASFKSLAAWDGVGERI